MDLPLPLRILPHGEGLALPAYETEGAAGLDLRAAIAADAELVIPPMGRAVIPTGLMMQIPAGHEVQLRPRSGLAARHGVTVLNSPGTIDSDYRGEVCVILINLGDTGFPVRRGDRIAQMVLSPVSRAQITVASVLDDTARGAGGFGSTGP